ncbi:hypothetical protein RUMOBE_02787 [Blautia obeum ATCC 29174]|uniref:Uncharacterized protein n=1 Tax=Blautia obeum ATCC 29174 TaxID=411459 RepID=A5ZUV2_9FIRM|nr:hypothetical protein RUMOBE_02787 [Blautia obeum ATCC 29174]
MYLLDMKKKNTGFFPDRFKWIEQNQAAEQTGKK